MSVNQMKEKQMLEKTLHTKQTFIININMSSVQKTGGKVNKLTVKSNKVLKIYDMASC